MSARHVRPMTLASVSIALAVVTLWINHHQTHASMAGMAGVCAGVVYAP
jgi:hypothetical protein